jgi:putative flippase GtrA
MLSAPVFSVGSLRRAEAATLQLSLPPAFLRVLRWVLAGGGSLALQLVIQGVLVDWLAVPARAGIVLAYELALLAHFAVNDRWVFGAHQGRGVWCRLLAFHAAALGAEAVTLAVAFLLLGGSAVALLGPTLAPYLATVAGVIAATAVTFSASFLWIWRR